METIKEDFFINTKNLNFYDKKRRKKRELPLLNYTSNSPSL